MRYKVQRIDVAITEESLKNAEEESDPWESVDADLRGALDALESNCWDNIDETPGAIICYPADYEQNIRTGDYESFQIIVVGKERHLEWLMKVYHNKMAEEQRKWNERTQFHGNQTQYTGDA